MEIYVALGSAPAKTLNEAALVPEVRGALMRWLSNQPDDERGVLIGGLALSFYARPRQTMDVDLLFAQAPDFINPMFKRTRDHGAIDKKDHVEIEFVTHKTIGIPQAVAKRVIDTAWQLGSTGPKVASLDAMIVMKLYGADSPKRRRQDEADIQAMLENNPRLNMQELIQSWQLSDAHRTRLLELHELAGS